MPLTSDGIVPSTSSNKITPVETDHLSPTATDPLEESPGPEGGQDLVELAREELAKPSGSEEPTTSESQGRAEVAISAKEEEQLPQEGLDNLATQGVCITP